MKRQFYRRLLALSTAVLLGLSSLFPSIAGATEITAEEPAVTDTVDPAASTDTSNPASADTVETADGETTEETTEPERLEPAAYRRLAAGTCRMGRIRSGDGSRQWRFPVFQKYG